MSELGIIFAIIAHAAWPTAKTQSQSDFVGWATIIAIACGIAGVWL